MNILPKPKILGVVTLNAKGQIVIPKEIREQLKISTNDQLILMNTPFVQGIALVPPAEVEKHLGKMHKELQKTLEELDSTNQKNNL